MGPGVRQKKQPNEAVSTTDCRDVPALGFTAVMSDVIGR